jgi:hypothetical protein
MTTRSAVLPLASALVACVVISSAWGQGESRVSEPTAAARELVDSLVKGDFSTTGKHFDKAMRDALPEEKLKQAWTALTDQVGEFVRVAETRAEKGESGDVAIVSCKFEKAPIDIKVIFNRDRQVGGLFFLPVTIPPGETPETLPMPVRF